MLPPPICRSHVTPADIAQATEIALATVDAGTASTEAMRRGAWAFLRTHGARPPRRAHTATDAPDSA